MYAICQVSEMFDASGQRLLPCPIAANLHVPRPIRFFPWKPKERKEPMRMKKREVTDKDEIFGILARSRAVHVGMFGDNHPYVVPVSFGMEVVDGKALVYFHCGKRGLKIDLLKRNPNVCIEADVFHAYELLQRGIDTRYESVIGFGRCEEVFGDEKLHGLELLCEHCGYAGHDVSVCLGLDITSVYRITVEEITGKRTLPEYWKQAGAGTPYCGG